MTDDEFIAKHGFRSFELVRAVQINEANDTIKLLVLIKEGAVTANEAITGLEIAIKGYTDDLIRRMENQ